jgi:hypothetical protein
MAMAQMMRTTRTPIRIRADIVTSQVGMGVVADTIAVAKECVKCGRNRGKRKSNGMPGDVRGEKTSRGRIVLEQ